MANFDVNIIDQPTAKAMLVEFKSQRQDNVPVLKHPGHYILPDYKLTRQRKAFKIRKHTYLTKSFVLTSLQIPQTDTPFGCATLVVYRKQFSGLKPE